LRAVLCGVQKAHVDECEACRWCARACVRARTCIKVVGGLVAARDLSWCAAGRWSSDAVCLVLEWVISEIGTAEWNLERQLTHFCARWFGGFQAVLSVPQL
jgi:hypothetical protein